MHIFITDLAQCAGMYSRKIQIEGIVCRARFAHRLQQSFPESRVLRGMPIVQCW